MIKDKKIKRSSHPMMFFIYVSLLVIILSGILSALNVQITYDKLTTIIGEVESTTTTVNSLISLDGFKFLLTSLYDNLVSFAPFGSLLMAAIAFGIALKSGFLKTLCNRITKKVPKFIIVFLYSLLCIIISVDGNLGYVLLLPFGAILFMSMNRNPIGGLALGFSSLSMGYGAGLFINSLDYNLSSYTEASAKLLDTDYMVSQSSNLIFIIVASILIAAISTFITEKFISRKLGRNQFEEDEETIVEEQKEKKGLIGVLILTIILLIPFVLMLIPTSKDGFIGLLLDKSQSTYSKMLFSSDALLMNNLVGIISILLILQSFVYGVITGTIKKIRDLVNFSTDYLKTVGGIFVLIFFAAQLSAIIKESNLGVVITASLSNLVSASEFSFIPLVILLFFVTMICNVISPQPVAKWSILAPNIMSTVMKANITPEFSQIIFRAGDSVTNLITPAFSYFVIFIGFVEVYTKNKNDFSIRNCYRVILPYFFAIGLVWLVLIICWYVIGLPIGPGIYPAV